MRVHPPRFYQHGQWGAYVLKISVNFLQEGRKIVGVQEDQIKSGPFRAPHSLMPRTTQCSEFDLLWWFLILRDVGTLMKAPETVAFINESFLLNRQWYHGDNVGSCSHSVTESTALNTCLMRRCSWRGSHVLSLNTNHISWDNSVWS